MSEHTNSAINTTSAILPVATSILRQIPLREAFATEALLEQWILADLRSETSELATILGIKVKDCDSQKTVGNLRPDILVNTNGADAEIIIELTLNPLDREHLQRGVLYAIERGATTLVIIMPEIEYEMFKLVQQYARNLSNIVLTILTIRVFNMPNGNYGHLFEEAFGAEEEAPATREQQLLKHVQKELENLGNSSLSHLAVQKNRRLEYNRGGARYTLSAGQSATTITLNLRGTEKDPSFAERTFARMIQSMAVIDDSIIDHTTQWGGHPDFPGGTRLSISVDYDRTIAALNDETEFNSVARKIANAYNQFHAVTTRYF